MKVAFVGKGGSGKTTLSALLTRTIASKGLPVIAIDADINQQLAEALGVPTAQARSMRSLGAEIDVIKDYVRGHNARIAACEPMIKTTPPGRGSRLLTVTEQNAVYDRFALLANGVRVLAAGPYAQADLGVRCYHSKTGAVELLLNHLIDGPREYVVTDMTAGADSFASGLFTRFDVTFIVVEPTLKSLAVYDQYKQYAADYDVLLKVVANKVRTAEDLAFVQHHVGSDYLTACRDSDYVRQSEKGMMGSLAEVEDANLAALAEMLERIDAQTKDWNKFYRQAVEFHTKNARGWANAQVGKDLTNQIDPRFDMQESVNAYADLTGSRDLPSADRSTRVGGE